MFWVSNPSSPQIDSVLFKEDLTVNELLDQENILQELKSQNTKLVDFITRGDVMSQLVSLVTEEPSSDLDEREKYRRPNIACEVLTTDILRVNERLSEKSFLTKLYAFLETEPPLNPLLASFFSRTLSMLICRKLDQNWYSYQFTCLLVLEFFKSHENSLQLLLKHLGTSAIMDLLLKLITQVEGKEMQQNILEWFENGCLVESLVSLFNAKVEPVRQYNASQLLCDTVRKLREISATTSDSGMANSILDSIQSPQMIDKLLGNMLNDEISESSIVGGISVLLTLLEPVPGFSNCQDEYGLESENSALRSTVKAIIPYLPKLHNLLTDPPRKAPVKLACGTIEPPLGETRLSIIKLFAALIATNTPEVGIAMDELNTVQVLLDLFFHYTWNNFLHTQVDKCLAFALNISNNVDPENNALISNIFIKCRLLQRILGAWEENDEEQSKGGRRRGYMGHLTSIANTVVAQSSRVLGDFINDNINPDTLLAWNHFVHNDLTAINEIQKKCLGGQHPSHSSSKDDGVYKDAFPDDETGQQSYLFQNYADFQPKSQDYMQNLIFQNFCSNDQLVDSVNAEEAADIKAFTEICTQIGPEMFGQTQKDDWKWHKLPNNVWDASDDSINSLDEEEIDPVTSEGYLDADFTVPIWKTSNQETTPGELGETKPTTHQANPTHSGRTLWSSVGVGTPVVDPGNPWQKADGAPPDATEANEGWANFDSNDDSVVFKFEQFRFSPDPSTQPQQDVVVEEGQGQVDTSQPDLVVGETGDKEKSDNNANLGSLTKQDTIPDDELIDNFKFLSKQGMIAENSVPADPSSPQASVEVKKDEKSPERSSEEGLVGVEAEKTSEVPGDPV